MTEQYSVAGLNLHPAATPVEIRKGEDGKLTLVAESKESGQVVLQGLDHVLMATGRKPNTRGLGCEEVRCTVILSASQMYGKARQDGRVLGLVLGY